MRLDFFRSFFEEKRKKNLIERLFEIKIGRRKMLKKKMVGERKAMDLFRRYESVGNTVLFSR